MTKKLMGGFIISSLYVRSGFSEILHGIGMPGFMSLVRSLNSLQKFAMLMPRWPSWGPSGGPGMAEAAGM
uniref:Uncharacterized protein n=1 Tax=Ixodes ricinus TaxID=34613 RepID=A0A6B0U1K6_IXORI